MNKVHYPPFGEKMLTCSKSMYVFNNLGGDATLIAPILKESNQHDYPDDYKKSCQFYT